LKGGEEDMTQQENGQPRPNELTGQVAVPSAGLENKPKGHTVRNAGAVTAILLAVAVGSAALGGVSRGDAKPSYTPSPTATEQATPKPSEAAGSASLSINPSQSPEASASVAPSASAEAPQFVVVKDGSVGQNTIVKLPANTVITGDPFFLGGQPGSGGKQLEDYQTFQIDVNNMDSQSLTGGQAMIDSDPTTGAVFVLKEDTYVQTGISWGFSYQTVQNADQAEKLAIGQKFVTEHLGCSGGCQHVDIIHFPGDPPQGTVTDGTNPSQSPMPSQDSNSGLMPTASEMPAGSFNLGSITNEEEIMFLQNLISSGKVDMNSDTGKILASLLKCLECPTVCSNPTETPTPSASPKPTPRPAATPAVCTPTKHDTVEPAGFVFKSTNGEAFIVEAAATIDGNQGFTTNNDSTKVKQIDLVNDGKNHTVAFNFAGDLQEFNSCATDKFITDTYNHDLGTDSRALDPRSIKLTK